MLHHNTMTDQLQQRLEYLRTVLSISNFLGLFDWPWSQPVFLICFLIAVFDKRVAIIVFIFLHLPTSPLNSSRADSVPTAESGKYISEEVNTPTEAPERPAQSFPPSYFQGEGLRFGRKAQAVMVVDEERPDLERSDSLQEDQPTPSANIQSVEETVKEQETEVAEKETVGQVEPDTIEGPSEHEFSLEKDNALQIDLETNEALIDGHISTGAEDNGCLPSVPQTNNIYTAADITSGTHDIGSAIALNDDKQD